MIATLWGVARDGASRLRARISDAGGIAIAGDNGAALRTLLVDASDNLRVVFYAGATALGFGPSTMTTTKGAIAAAAAEIVPARANRVYSIVKNEEAAGGIDVYVAESNAQAVLANGITLQPQQAVTLPGTFAIHASSASGTPVLTVIEAHY